MSTEILQVKKLSDNAFLPVRGTPYAAGFDLSSAYDAVVPARGKVLVKTDLSSKFTQTKVFVFIITIFIFIYYFSSCYS